MSPNTEFKKGHKPHNYGTKTVWIKHCEHCNNEFVAYYERLRFCSMGCSAESIHRGKEISKDIILKMLTTKKQKDNTYGTRTPLNKKVRTGKKWRDWRKKVFERDDYTCQDCGRHGCYIEPHHIIHVKELVENGDIKMIYNIDNGITLCRECHMLRHSKQMRGD